ncbi:MAG: carboxypeptidase-like regulatory domain-containing protein, partial [bacterium]
TDWLVRSFNLTDGQANMIGGVTNVNIPYDSDPTPGAIRTEAGFLTVGLSQTCVGRYLYRFSSPTGGFAAATNAFAVTNTVYGQGFTGKVQCNGTNIPYAGVLVMEDERGPIAETVADGSGTYSIQVAPGVYQLGAFKSGYVCDMGTQPAFTLGAGSPITTNLNLIPATQSISGRFVDATNSSIGLPGMLVVAQSTNNLLVLGFTGTNGDFAVPVTASGWEVGVDDEALSSYGYLSFQDRSPIDTTTGSVSGVAIAFPRGTALFYGTVKDDQNHPLAGLSLNAEDNGDYYSEGRGVTDTNGNYAIAVLAGAWHVKPSNNSPGYGNYLFSGVNTNIADGQAARVNFTGCIGVTVSGCVRGGGAPLEGLNVQVGTIIFHEGGGWNWQQTYQGNSTDSGGRYSIIVPPGTNYYVQVNPSQGSTWLGQFYSNAMDAVGATVVVALTNAPATNIDFNLQQGASVSGRVKGGGSPLAGIEVKAGMVTFRSGGGSDFQDQGSRGHSDSNGYYTLVLPPGTDYTVVANPDNSGSPWLTQYYSNTMDIAQAKLVTALTNAPATNINFNLNQGAIVSGYVLGNGAPLSGLWVGVGTITTNQGGGWNWKQSYYSNSSDSNGNYSVTVPPGSNYYAQVSLPHGSPWLQQFYSNAMDYSSATVISVLTNAPATNINFNLNQGAIVSGYVLGNGAPLNGVNVQVGTITTNQGGGWNWNQSYDANNGTDSNGYYSVTLPPGTNYYASVCSSPWLRQFYSNATDYSSATVISALTNAPATNINFY